MIATLRDAEEQSASNMTDDDGAVPHSHAMTFLIDFAFITTTILSSDTFCSISSCLYRHIFKIS